MRSRAGSLLEVLLWIGLATGLASCAERPDSPNLLLVTVDTTRADHLGAYGYELPTSPNIDSLAAESILFEHAYSHVPITLPAHTTIMTGRLPLAHGVRDNGRFVVPERLETLAERLAARGYSTAAFVSAFVLDSRFGLAQGFSVYNDHYREDWGEDELRDARIYNNAVTDRPADQTTDRAIAWLRRADRPFFLWVHYYDPHQRYDPPRPYAQRFAHPYDGEIAFMDSQIGRLLASLRSQRMFDSTLIALVGDHGESLGQHDELTHATLVYDTTLHVPFLLKPQASHAFEPTRITEPVYHVDVLPTVLDLLGLEPSASGHGTSLLGLTRGESLGDRSMYFECILPHFSFDWEPLFGLRRGRWKYIQAPRPELYDVETDPDEIFDRVEDEPTRVEQMRSELFRVVDAVAAASAGTEVASLGAQSRHQLEALGYLTGTPSPAVELNPRQPTGRRNPRQGMLLLDDYFTARNLASQGHLLEAISVYETVLLPLDPANPAFLKDLAELERRSGDPQRAYELLRRLLRQRPEDVEVLKLLGQLELDRADPEAARGLLAAACELAPRDISARYQLGRALARLGELEASIRAYEQILRDDPSHVDSRVNLGITLARAGRLDEARASFEAAVEQAPGAARAHYNLGLFELRQGRTEEALRCFERALAERPGYDDARLGQAVAVSALGRGDEARGLLESLLEADPDPAIADQARRALAATAP